MTQIDWLMIALLCIRTTKARSLRVLYEDIYSTCVMIWLYQQHWLSFLALTFLLCIWFYIHTYSNQGITFYGIAPDAYDNYECKWYSKEVREQIVCTSNQKHMQALKSYYLTVAVSRGD